MTHATHLEDLQQSIRYRFTDPGLLLRALTHRSYAHEHAEVKPPDNETFEFLGDAVLGLAISQLLLEQFPACNEGELSRLRSSLVNERELARIAASLDLGGYLLLGKGEEQTGGREKASLLSDSLEALLAAIYLDGGLDRVIPLIARLFSGYLEQTARHDPLQALDRDFKTQLQELTQAQHKLTPTYEIEGEEGPDHDKRFLVRVLLDQRVLARGWGKSKKEAQQQAARKALALLAQELAH